MIIKRFPFFTLPLLALTVFVLSSPGATSREDPLVGFHYIAAVWPGKINAPIRISWCPLQGPTSG